MSAPWSSTRSRDTGATARPIASSEHHGITRVRLPRSADAHCSRVTTPGKGESVIGL